LKNIFHSLIITPYIEWVYAKNMKKILIIRFSSLGDIVLTEPVVRLLRINFIGCQIHYLTKPEYFDLVNSFGKIDKIHLWIDQIHLINELKDEKFDYIIDLQNKFNSFLVKLFIRAKKSITFNKQHLTRKLIIKKLTTKHIDSIVWNYLETLKKVKETNFEWKLIANERSFYPILSTNINVLEKTKEILSYYNIPTNLFLVGIFPGAQHKTKQFPISKLANFMYEVPHSWNCCFLLLGDWKDKTDALKIKSMSEHKVYDLTGAFCLSQLVAVVSLLDCVISNDSGPMHISAALQKHQIAIFGATHTKLGFRPLNDRAIILQAGVKCQPCSLHGGDQCPRNNATCFRNISSDEVFAYFKQIYENKDYNCDNDTGNITCNLICK